MGVNVRITSGPAIERAGDLAAILTNLKAGDVLFIDEIHRLGRAIEEVLYPAMEDFALDIVIGKGPSARNIRLKLPHFTVVGATTRLALVSSPLRARFGSVYRLDYYEQAVLEQIIRRAANLLNVPIDPGGLAEIARRGRGTPRVALRLLRRVRDYAQVRGDGTVDGARWPRSALSLLDVDPWGWTISIGAFEGHHRVIRRRAGGPKRSPHRSRRVRHDHGCGRAVSGCNSAFDRTRAAATRRAYEHLNLTYPERAGEGRCCKTKASC
jgi:Holliday junction DNA helicase RuvB